MSRLYNCLIDCIKKLYTTFINLKKTAFQYKISNKPKRKNQAHQFKSLSQMIKIIEILYMAHNSVNS